MLRYNGLYVSDSPWVDATGTSYFSYLRFYEDRHVIQVTSSGTPDQLTTWFTRENPANSKGLYYHGIPYRDDWEEKLHFAVVSAEGVVGYMGDIVNDQLILRSYSLINDRSDTKTFRFVAIT
ncbi:hypothetical protein [Spirosoma jeollabukense]